MVKRKSILLTDESIEAGIHALSCEFGFPSENPVVCYEEAAVRVFRAMLAHITVMPAQDSYVRGSQQKQIPYKNAPHRER